MDADVEEHLQDLYAAPLKNFISARNAKAAALKAAGRGPEAQALLRLGKPSLALWAANQLPRLVPEQIDRFIDLVQVARRRQLEDPRAAAEAMKTQRAEATALTARAAEAIAKAGQRASSATLGRISSTLLGAAVDRRLSEALRHGRLTAEVDAPGFEVLAGLSPGADLRLLRGGRASRREAEDSAARQAREQAEREQAAREAETARRHAAERAAVAEQAGQEVRELERRLAEARQRHLAARRDATAAARRVPRPGGSPRST
jgi:hypothetical protein